MISIMAGVCCVPSEAGAQLLWKITGDGVEGVSWLLGTHHAAPKAVLDSIDGFRDAFGKVDVVYGEVVADSASSPRIQNMMMKAMRLPEGITLGSLYSEDEMETVGSFVESVMGTGLESLGDMTPAAIGTLMTQMALVKSDPSFMTEGGLDMVIQRMAMENGKRTAGLETYEEQVELLYKQPLDEQAEALLEMAGEGEEAMLALLDEMNEAYRNQNIEYLNSLVMEDMTEDEVRLMLHERNQKWIPIMLDAMRDTSSLFAVGAGHLLGDYGLIRLLQTYGCTVEPVVDRL